MLTFLLVRKIKSKLFIRMNFFCFSMQHYNDSLKKQARINYAAALSLPVFCSSLFNACEKQKKISAGELRNAQGSSFRQKGV